MSRRAPPRSPVRAPSPGSSVSGSRIATVLAAGVLAFACCGQPSPSQIPSASTPSLVAPSPTPSRSGSPTPVPTPVPSPTPVPTPTSPPDAWVRVTLPGATEIADVVATGTGFLAVGRGETGAVSWTSPDGITWTRGPDDPGLDEAVMRTVVRTPSGFLATGAADADWGTGVAAVWTSGDGRTWRRAPSQASLTARVVKPHESSQISFSGGASDGDLTLVGGTYAWKCSDSGCYAAQPSVWRSTDGSKWKRVALGAGLGSGPQGVVDLTGLVHFDRGWVATGWSWSGKGVGGSNPLRPVRTLVWTSRDGKTWRRTSTKTLIWSLVVARPDLLLAVGMEPGSGSEARPLVVLRSSDGTTWRRAAHLPARLTATSDLASDGTTFALLDSGSDSDPSREPSVWVSRDGDRWDALALSHEWVVGAGAHLGPVAVAGGRVVVAGSRDTSDGSVACVWTFDLADPAPRPALPEPTPEPSTALPPAVDSTELSPSPSSITRARAAVTLGDGRLLVVGPDATVDPVDPYVPVRQATAILDPSTGSWSAAAPMRRARSTYAIARGVDGHVYVFGGDDLDGQGVRVEAFDPATNGWSERRSMPVGKTWESELAAATAPDGRIFVFGGDRFGRTPEVYDPTTDRWSKGPALPWPAGVRAAVTGADGRIYVLTAARVWVLDPAAGQWTPRAALPATWASDSLDLLPGPAGSFVVVRRHDTWDEQGGCAARSAATIASYDPAVDRWTELATLADATRVLKRQNPEEGSVYSLVLPGATFATSPDGSTLYALGRYDVCGESLEGPVLSIPLAAP